MRFRKITFSNYRCFMDGSVSFEENEDKGQNINLILGSNGSGKTEILFSFIWAMYGFDFKTLKGKEDTPYALNADRYRLLERSSSGDTDECFVEIELEDGGIKYFVRRIARYTKARKVECEEVQELSYEKETHERSVPIRDKQAVEEALSRIIPESTLTGLVFDGERMQKLSRVDDGSQKTIKAVVRDVTNVELLEDAKEAFTGARDAVQQRFRKRGMSKHAIEREIYGMDETISNSESEINRITPILENLDERLGVVEAELASIQDDLERDRKTREYAVRQKAAMETRDSAKVDIDKDLEDLIAALADGYLMCSEPLFVDVMDTIKTCDVPEGLTVPSIDSILKRVTCICGEPLDEAHRAALEKLKESLPPNNINSTLSETVRFLRQATNDVRAGAKRVNDSIRQHEKSYAEAKEEIRSISAILAGSDSEEIADLENRRLELIKEQAEIERQIAENKEALAKAEKDHQKATQRRKELSSKNDELLETQVQIDFYEKALSALKRIRVLQEENALTRINELLIDAYSLISEGAKLGRRIHLVQHATRTKFRMVVYNKASYDSEREYLRLTGKLADMRSKKSASEVEEEIILACADSNSTGQSKINTLAFVKAILDYANEQKDGSFLGVSKNYPLLIDAPFGDIFDENLLLSSSALHTFAGQIILMLADDSYESVKKQIESHVSSVTSFKKLDNENRSVIVGG